MKKRFTVKNMKTEKQKKLESFVKLYFLYVENWKYLESYKVPLVWRIIFPIGFYFRLRNLNRMSKLTRDYSEYLDTFNEQYLTEKESEEKEEVEEKTEEKTEE